ncbi:MAG: methyltransferase, partial [Bacteroidota bacterium]|nr:methyltransferase [Bacteroidota bacterium]
MPNTYFQFKQFIVHQEKSAMKVCTDSCLFGAWAANHLCNTNKNVNRILDVGAGTGLLSLMLAQQCDAIIDAVETDGSSANEANENFLQSSWQERLHCYEKRIQDFYAKETYDFIICNPPFYEKDLLGKNKPNNVAHHNAGLILRELITAVKRLLNEEGSFAILLPYHRTK